MAIGSKNVETKQLVSLAGPNDILQIIGNFNEWKEFVLALFGAAAYDLLKDNIKGIYKRGIGEIKNHFMASGRAIIDAMKSSLIANNGTFDKTTHSVAYDCKEVYKIGNDRGFAVVYSTEEEIDKALYAMLVFSVYGDQMYEKIYDLVINKKITLAHNDDISVKIFFDENGDAFVREHNNVLKFYKLT